MDISELFGSEPWDPDTDEEFQAVLHQVRTVPPSCLCELTATPSHSEQWSSRATWTLACACGNTEGAVLGYPLDEITDDPSLKGQFVGPLAFRCASCDQVTEMFDSALHGYDAEISKGSPLSHSVGYRGDGPRLAAKCPQCAATKCAVTCDFTHSHFDHIEDESDLLEVAQDYFDGFGCKATCAGCGHEWWVAGFELA